MVEIPGIGRCEFDWAALAGRGICRFDHVDVGIGAGIDYRCTYSL